MVQLIRNRTIGGILLGLIILALSKMFFEFVPEPPNVIYTPLFNNIKKMFEGYQLVEIITASIFVVLQAIFLTFILQYHKVIKERTFFPFIIYILLAIVYNEQFYLNPTSFLNFFLLLITERMLRLQDAGKSAGLLFLDIGTIVGLSLLFSKEAIFFIPAIIIGIIIISTYDSSNILILILSLIMVLIITSGIYYLTGNIGQFVSFFSFSPVNIDIIINHWQERFYYLLALILVLTIITYTFFQFKSTSVSNKAKRFAGVFLLIFFTSQIIVVIQEVNIWCNMALFAIPTSVFAANYFQETKGNNWLKNIVLLLLIIALVSIQLNY